MSCLEAKCQAIFDDLAPINNLSLSADGTHPLLDWLMANLPQLLSMLGVCLPVPKKNGAGLAEALKNPNLRQRAGVKFFMVRHIDDPRTGNVTVRQMSDAFYKIGASVTPEEGNQLWSEVAA